MIIKRNFLLLLLVFSQLVKAQHIHLTTGKSFSDTKSSSASKIAKKNVLIITDGVVDLKSPATVEARRLDNLLGHFRTSVTILGARQYSAHKINRYDIIFYIGSKSTSQASPAFMNDAYHTKKTVVWMNGGIVEFEKVNDIKRKYGFSVVGLDSVTNYNTVTSGKNIFRRKPESLFIVQISNKKKVSVLATAKSTEQKKDTPYIVRSGNLYYIADVPLPDVYEADRYLLFADLLHDIIGEHHPESHRAIVRIEDVIPTRDPDDLRNIADILSSRNIPFLVGVIPFYVNPGENSRISLSDRPELVKALKYCVRKGATIVLHGETHQYKGVSAIDFEFWDKQTNKPIPGETPQEIAGKIEDGIDECIKNGIYPLLWETPHYTASMETYQTVSKYFGSSIERRLVADNSSDGQYFPYLINKDIYGEKIYPEDLGYLPLLQQKDSSEHYIHHMIENARVIYNVRDGYASFFFHPFLNLDYLKQIVDGIKGLGFSFVDLRQETNWVKTKDKIILSGSQSYAMNLNHSFLNEIYYDKSGKIEKTIISDKQINGIVSKRIVLKPDEFYIVEPLEYHVSAVSNIKKDSKNDHHS